MKRILIALTVFVLTAFSFSGFGRCPLIEGHFTPDGTSNKDSYIDIDKKDCSTFDVTTELGELTLTINLGAVEKCEDFLFRKLCYSGSILGANEVVFNFKESWKPDGCIRDEILKIDEAKKTIEGDIKVNCGERGITVYPKFIFHKMGDGAK
jgi:hypothetical protein